MGDRKQDIDVLVVGGGVAGLTTAFFLLAAGQRVLLVDQNIVGQEASWAGGGILSPLRPWRYSTWHDQLTQLSLACLQQITNQMSQVGITFEQTQTGMLYVNEVADAALSRWLQTRDDLVLHENKALRSLCAQLSLNKTWADKLENGVWMPKVSNLRNPDFLQALKSYLIMQPGFTLIERACASLVFSDGQQGFTQNKILGVDISNHGQETDFLSASQVVITAGAWSTQLLARHRLISSQLPLIKPIRGQMLLFKPKTRLTTMVMQGNHYMIPRADGLVLVGSTVEDVGFCKQTTNSARQILLEFASAVLPELQGVEPLRHWAGLRPVVVGDEGMPLLGRVPGVQGLWINSGHYRNGIVHAAGAGQLIAQSIQGYKPSMPLTIDGDKGYFTIQDQVFLSDSEVI